MSKRYGISTPGKAARCKHPWCSDCKTKRGRNRGNRSLRHKIKAALKKNGYGE